jgi:cell division protein FtsB
MIKALLVKYGVIFLAIFFAISLIGNVYKIRSAKKRFDDAQEKLASLKEEQKTLEEQLNVVKSQAYIEKQARDKLGLAKEGEIVLVLPDKEVLKSLSPRKSEESSLTLPDPNWKKWMKLFI